MVYIIMAVNSYLLANYFQSWIIFEYIFFAQTWDSFQEQDKISIVAH